MRWRFGRFFKIRPPGGAAIPGPGITVPTLALTKTNAAGATLTFTFEQEDYLVGYYWNFQAAADAAFTTPLYAEGAIREDIRIATVTDFTDDDLDGDIELDSVSVLEAQQTGTIYFRLRLGYDDGEDIIWGDWSNTISEAVVLESPSVFDATAKGAHITRSGGNLTVTTALSNQGAPERARADTSRTGKRYFEMTVTAIPTGNSYIGVGPSTHNWTAISANVPGSAGSGAGISLSNGGTVFHSTGTTVSSVTAAWALNDVIMCAFDTATGKVWFGRNGTWNGDPGAGTGGFTPTGMDLFYAFAAMTVKNTDQRAMTANFGASAFAHPIPSGFTDYT